MKGADGYLRIHFAFLEAPVLDLVVLGVRNYCSVSNLELLKCLRIHGKTPIDRKYKLLIEIIYSQLL